MSWKEVASQSKRGGRDLRAGVRRALRLKILSDLETSIIDFQSVCRVRNSPKPHIILLLKQDTIPEPSSINVIAAESLLPLPTA